MSRSMPALLCACALFGCSEKALPEGQVKLTLGQEEDTWAGSEVAVVETESSGGDLKEILRTDAPLSRFDMGSGGVTSFVVTGLDAAGLVRVQGRSLPVNRDGFSGITLPLFVSRAGELGRPPGGLLHAEPDRPPVDIMSGRYVYAFGGSDGDRAQADGYDLGVWRPLVSQQSLSCPSPPCRVRSFAIVAGTLGLAVGDDWGIALDFANSSATDAPMPDGLDSFADVSGGATVHASDGSAYIVGATRDGEPTATVIRIDPDGILNVALLTTPRARAAAAWVEGRGLVVVGGASAPSAGAELLAEGSTAFVALPFPADTTVGAALTTLDNSSVLRLGGLDESGAAAETVSIALGCGTSCTPAPTGPTIELAQAQAFPLPSGKVLVVGDDATGATSAAVWLDTDVAETLPLREPRSGASALALPTGHVAIVGGAHPDGTPAGSIELFIE